MDHNLEWYGWPGKLDAEHFPIAPKAKCVEAPEGPHVYLKDGYYYLLVAEGDLIEIGKTWCLLIIQSRWYGSRTYGDYGKVNKH